MSRQFNYKDPGGTADIVAETARVTVPIYAQRIMCSIVHSSYRRASYLIYGWLIYIYFIKDRGLNIQCI